MYLTIVFTAILLLAVFLSFKVKKWSLEPFLTGLFLILSIIGMLCIVIAIPTGRSNDRVYALEMKVYKTALENARKDSISPIERAELTKFIMVANTELMKRQYAANSEWLNWFSDKKILDVEPLK